MGQADKRFIAIIVAILAVAVVATIMLSGGLSGMATRVSSSCSDSDGGIVITAYGWVTGKIGKTPYTYTDSCTNGTHVLERFCNASAPQSTVRSCLTYTTNSCQGGKCVDTSACSDTDGGLVPTVFGTVSGNRLGTPFSMSDTCQGTSLIEYYCSGTGQQSTSTSCITESTNACVNGACVYIPPMPPTCSDSDGIDRFVAGFVNGTANGQPYVYGDACLGTNFVLEWTCSGTTPVNSNLTCLTNTTNTCMNGACVYVPPQMPPSCSDSDGYNPFVMGFVNGTANGQPYTYGDNCLGTAYVLEWYCSGTTPMTGNVSCAMNGTTCMNGRCQ